MNEQLNDGVEKQAAPDGAVPAVRAFGGPRWVGLVIIGLFVGGVAGATAWGLQLGDGNRFQDRIRKYVPDDMDKHRDQTETNYARWLTAY